MKVVIFQKASKVKIKNWKNKTNVLESRLKEKNWKGKSNKLKFLRI